MTNVITLKGEPLPAADLDDRLPMGKRVVLIRNGTVYGKIAGRHRGKRFHLVNGKIEFDQYVYDVRTDDGRLLTVTEDELYDPAPVRRDECGVV